MQPKVVVTAWVDAFNRADVEALSALYADDAVNHQVAESPIHGRSAIRDMFAAEFAQLEMVCIVENIFQDGDWAILEWRDPLGLWGCGFFQVQNGKIQYQRGYWDKLTFLRLHGLPISGSRAEFITGLIEQRRPSFLGCLCVGEKRFTMGETSLCDCFASIWR